ncbi:phosphoribosylformylglycinamidine cyclo-ligase [Mobiluncus mulieris]|nr:phosphoribosylformylglycinamidine cyclo-ligase [Mobiluncus mulieris]
MTTNPYASSGVDVDAGDRAVELMKADVRATQGLGVLDTAATGGFAGLFDLQFATQGMRRPLLATSTDGVGTKVDLARRLGIWDTVGIDLVGMVVDDLTCAGIRPLFMTDYIACGRVEPKRIAALVRGVARACEEVDCALIAGETAEHPGLLGDDEFDIAGAATGVVDERRLLGPARVCAGDVLVGFASSGLHSNGYSLVRRIVAEAGLDWGAPVPAGVCPPVGSPFSGGGGLPGGAGGGGLPGGAGGGALGAGSLGANSLGASRGGGGGGGGGAAPPPPPPPPPRPGRSRPRRGRGGLPPLYPGFGLSGTDAFVFTSVPGAGKPRWRGRVVCRRFFPGFGREPHPRFRPCHGRWLGGEPGAGDSRRFARSGGSWFVAGTGDFQVPNVRRGLATRRGRGCLEPWYRHGGGGSPGFRADDS